MMRVYRGLIHKDDDSDYGLSFVEFPGCVSACENLAECGRAATEALELHIQGMVEDGDAIPEPIDLDAFEHARRESDAFAVFAVRVHIPG
jgi:predicted RNase H-like HicB family nuclease